MPTVYMYREGQIDVATQILPEVANQLRRSFNAEKATAQKRERERPRALSGRHRTRETRTSLAPEWQQGDMKGPGDSTHQGKSNGLNHMPQGTLW